VRLPPSAEIQERPAAAAACALPFGHEAGARRRPGGAARHEPRAGRVHLVGNLQPDALAVRPQRLPDGFEVDELEGLGKAVALAADAEELQAHLGRELQRLGKRGAGAAQGARHVLPRMEAPVGERAQGLEGERAHFLFRVSCRQRNASRR
jgi:hypothetical protein